MTSATGKDAPLRQQDSEKRTTQSNGVNDSTGKNVKANGDSEKAKEKPNNESSTTPAKDENAKEEDGQQTSKIKTFFVNLVKPSDWVLQHYKNPKSWKIVIRCSVASWAGLMLLLAGPSERMLGNAAFLVLIVSFIMPPSAPIANTIEQYLVATFLIAFSWAYSCFFIYIAHISRVRFSYPSQAAFGAAVGARLAAQGTPAGQIASAVQGSIFNAEYVEARSSIVLAIGFGVYTGFALFLRTWIGPSPYVFGIILSIICATICLLYNPLFPYPFYSLGATFFRPFICQIAINLVCCLLIFPESLHDQFLDRLSGVISPLKTIVSQQDDLLSTDPASEEWKGFAKHKALLAGASKALGMLGMTEGLLDRNIAFQRASGKDLKMILTCIRALTGRTSGFTYFHDFVQRHVSEPAEENRTADDLVMHFGRSRPGTPQASRSASFHDDEHEHEHEHEHGKRPETHRNKSHGLLHGLLHPHQKQHNRPQASRKSSRSQDREAEHARKNYRVGFVESQHYMLLEERLGHKDDLDYLPELLSTLRKSSLPVLHQLDESLQFVMDSLASLKSRSAWDMVRGKKSSVHSDLEASTDAEVARLKKALELYQSEERLEVVKAFVHLFDPSADEAQEMAFLSSTSHRSLFLAFTYQWSVMQYGQATLRLLESITEIQKKRKSIHLYIPPLRKLGKYFKSSGHQGGVVDEDPEEIDGLTIRDAPISRDADFLPPATRVQRMSQPLTRIFGALGSPNMLFAYKAGIISTFAAFPAFFASSASFYYKNRGLWSTIMVCLTMNRFVGDTTYQFVLRVSGTLIGAALGLVIWYIGNPTGATPYGTAAICAVVFPMMQFYRNFQPIIVQGILTMVTIILVVGYSWQDATYPSAGTIGVGWEVGWRRFVGVLIGITMAFIAAYLPPKSTQKTTIRKLYAVTLNANVSILFRVISLNLAKKAPLPRLPAAVIKNITAVRARLLQSALARNMIKFEVDFRGEWPADEYASLANLQVECVDLIGQFGTALATLDPVWTRAVLHRTHFDDPDFLGDISSSIALVGNALRTKSPMPYYHAPLLSTFFQRPYRFQVTLDDHDTRLPHHVDYQTLTSLEYLKFSCCVSLAYSLINRIDRIVHIAKKLTGEQLYVRGLGDMAKVQGTEAESDSDEDDGDTTPLRTKS